MLLNKNHLDGSALYVAPQNIHSQKITDYFKKLEVILENKNDLISVISEEKFKDVLDDIDLNNKEKLDNFNYLFLLANKVKTFNSKDKLLLIKIIFEKLKTSDSDKIITVYDKIQTSCIGVETLPIDIIINGITLISNNQDGYGYLQDELKKTTSGVFKANILKFNQFTESDFNTIFPFFHQTYLYLSTKKGLSENVIQERIDAYLNFRNHLGEANTLSKETKQKIIDQTFGPKLDKCFAKEDLTQQTAPILYLIKSIEDFHNKYPFFTEKQLVEVSHGFAQETLKNPDNHFMHKFANGNKFDTLLFERALFTKAIDIAKKDPDYKEKCVNAWTLDFFNALKVSPKNLVGQSIDYSIYLEMFTPLFIDPPSTDDIKALMHVTLAGDDLLRNTFGENQIQSAPQIAKGCVNFFIEQKKKIGTSKEVDAFLDLRKAELLLPYCVPLMSPLENWGQQLIKGYEYNDLFLKLANTIISAFSAHTEVQGPLTIEELKNLQKLIISGIYLINEEGYNAESIGIGCFHYFAEQRKEHKLVKAPLAFTNKGNSEELLPFCSGHLKPIEHWREIYTNFIEEKKYPKGSLELQFANLLIKHIEINSLGPVNKDELNILTNLIDSGNYFMNVNQYPPEAVAIGLSHYLQQFRNERVKLQMPKTLEVLSPFCFEGLIEVGMKNQPEKVQDALLLFNKIKNRHIPLTPDGQKRLNVLLQATLDPTFALGKGISDSMVKTKFRTVLQDLECGDIISINRHEYTFDILKAAFMEHQANLYQLMNFGDITQAILENPVRCINELLDPVINIIVGKNYKTRELIKKNISEVLKNLDQEKSSATLATKVIAQLTKIVPLSQALEMGLEISTPGLIEILKNEVYEIRNPSEEQQNSGPIALMISTIIPLFSTAHSNENSSLSLFLSNFQDIYPNLKTGKALIGILKFVPNPLQKILAEKILPQIIEFMINKQIQSIEKTIAKVKLFGSDEYVSEFNEKLRLAILIKNNSKKITVAASKLALILLKRHNLNRYDHLLQYLYELGKPEVKIDEKKLEGLILDSLDIILEEAEEYTGGLENLLEAARQLPHKSKSSLESANSIKQQEIDVIPLTIEQKTNQVKWKAEFAKAINNNYKNDIDSRKLAQKLESELLKHIFKKVFDQNQLSEIISTIGVGATIMNKLGYSDESVAIGCRRFFEQQLVEPNLKSLSWNFYISDDDRAQILPFCFEGIVEAQIQKEMGNGEKALNHISTTSQILTLLKKIEGREKPLNADGIKRLEILTHQMVSLDFTDNKSLLHPAVSNRFKAILSSVEAHSVNQINHSKIPLNVLEQAFVVSAKARLGKINLGKVRNALAENPAKCAKAMTLPIVNTFRRGENEKETSTMQLEVSSFIDGLSQGKSAKALSAKLNHFLDKFKVLHSAQVELNISTQRATGEIGQQIDDLRKLTDTTGYIPSEVKAEKLNLIAPLFVKGAKGILNAQKQRNEGLNLSQQSGLARALPEISSKIGMIKMALSAASFLGVPVLKPLLTLGIEYLTEAKIKNLQDDLKAFNLDENVEAQEDLAAQLEFFQYLYTHAEAAAGIALNIALPILKKHSLDKHDNLINYFVEVGNDPSKKISPPELMHHLCASADIFLDEINANYSDLIPGLIDGLRSLQEVT